MYIGVVSKCLALMICSAGSGALRAYLGPGLVPGYATHRVRERQILRGLVLPGTLNKSAAQNQYFSVVRGIKAAAPNNPKAARAGLSLTFPYIRSSGTAQSHSSAGPGKLALHAALHSTTTAVFLGNDRGRGVVAEGGEVAGASRRRSRPINIKTWLG